jgi:hypothetical protein
MQAQQRSAHRHGSLAHFQADGAFQRIVIQQIGFVVFGGRGDFVI